MQAVNAQRELSGTVTSTGDGQPVPGATVVVKNTTIGTTTNVDGFFQLSVPEDTRIIVFSYVGMVSQEVELGASNIVNAIMEPDIMDIEGVVVTALGITREKKALGYSVQDIQGDDLETAKENNIVNSLTGKVAGVQVTSASGAVGASSRIVIRGNQSFGQNQPLFVVDGVPITNYASDVDQWGGQDFGNGAMDLDPANIETVSVLKGANAAALYGSRASNGVILITTKKGKSGVSKGIGVTFNTAFGLQNIAYTPLYQNKYGQGYAGSEYYAKMDGIDPSNIAEYEAWSRDNSFSFYDGDWGGINDGIDESWGSRLDIGMNVPQYDSPLTDPKDPDTRTATPFVSNPNNVKDFFQTGYTFDNNLSFVGGSEKATARVGLGFQDTKGTIPNTDLKKILC
jgi:TonB-dependent SusC/RagA subfamily outer membrane receptor